MGMFASGTSGKFLAAGVVASALLGTAMCMTTSAIAQETASENSQQTGMQDDDAHEGIHLSAVFTELSYSKYNENDDIPNRDKSNGMAIKVGGVVSNGSNDTFVTPYLTFAKSDSDGSNQFSDIETDSSMVGAGVSVTHFVTPSFRVLGGGQVGTGSQDVVFNGADTSETDIDSYAAYGGVDVDLYAYENFLFGVSDQIGVSHTDANFQPGNSIGKGASRAWSNGFSLNGNWFATNKTILGARLTYIRLFGVESMPGEDPLDRNYGQVSINARHMINDSVSIYGSVDHVVFNDLYDSTRTMVGLMTFF